MQKTARLITEVLSPTVLVTLFLLATGTLKAGWFGFWTSLIAALFTALGPFVGILVATKRGNVSDHHVGDRKQRLPILIASLGSAIVGFFVLLLIGAPKVVTVGLVGVSLGMIVVGAVNAFWKLSVHNAVVMFVVVGLIVNFGPWWVVGIAAPVLVGWSRVKLKDHTVAQVTAGAIAGGLVGVAYALML